MVGGWCGSGVLGWGGGVEPNVLLDGRDADLELRQEAKSTTRPWKGIEKLRVRLSCNGHELARCINELILLNGLLEEARLVRIHLEEDKGGDGRGNGLLRSWDTASIQQRAASIEHRAAINK